MVTACCCRTTAVRRSTSGRRTRSSSSTATRRSSVWSSPTERFLLKTRRAQCSVGFSWVQVSWGRNAIEFETCDFTLIDKSVLTQTIYLFGSFKNVSPSTPCRDSLFRRPPPDLPPPPSLFPPNLASIRFSRAYARRDRSRCTRAPACSSSSPGTCSLPAARGNPWACRMRG